MSLIKRGETYWCDITIKGKRYRESLRTGNKREAEARAKAFERAVWEGRTFDTDQLSVVDSLSLSKVFREHYELHWSSTKDAKGVWGRFETLSRFVDPETSLAKFDAESVKRLILDMKKATYARSPQKDAKQYPYSLSTINRVMALLGYLLNRLEEEGKITKAPRMLKFDESQRTRFLHEDEETRMFKALAESDDPMMKRCLGLFAFLADTGCRIGEVTEGKLQWNRVYLGDSVVLLEDTKADNDVMKPLTTRAKHVLVMEQSEGFKYPFEKITEYWWRKAWDYAKKEAGLGDDKRLVRHSLRHTTASRLVQRGIDTTVVQGLLGHKSALTTKRYAHLAIEHQKSAIAVLERVSDCVLPVSSPCVLTDESVEGIMRTSTDLTQFFNSPIAQSVERRTVNPVTSVRDQVKTPKDSNT